MPSKQSDGNIQENHQDIEEKLLEEMMESDDEIEEQESEPEIELLSFFVGKEEYAFDVFEVREIIKYHSVTSIPRCPEYILGVISLRGEIVPIIDLKKRLVLKGSASAIEPMIIITNYENKLAGFVVESISGIHKIYQKDIETTPEVIPPDKAEFLKGVVRPGEHLITILNMERLIDIIADFEDII